MCHTESAPDQSLYGTHAQLGKVNSHACRRCLTCSGARPETVRCTRGSLKESWLSGSVPTVAALYGMEMSSMMFVANKSLLDASTTPEQSAADSSATSTCLVDVMMFCAFFRRRHNLLAPEQGQNQTD